MQISPERTEMDCGTCQHRLTHGRADRDPIHCRTCHSTWTGNEAQHCVDRDPIHCRTCHSTWTGNEAQHCVRCHRTFSAVSSADAHRYRRLPDGTFEDRCVDPAITDGWREKRPGIPAYTRFIAEQLRPQEAAA